MSAIKLLLLTLSRIRMSLHASCGLNDDAVMEIMDGTFGGSLKIKGEFSTQFKRLRLEAKSVDAMEGCKETKFGWGKRLKSRKRSVA